MTIPASPVVLLCPPNFCQRQALLFYVESEPRGTLPVPNVESLVFTPWKYAICPDRDLHPEPSDWRTCVLTMRPLQLDETTQSWMIDSAFALMSQMLRNHQYNVIANRCYSVFESLTHAINHLQWLCVFSEVWRECYRHWLIRQHDCHCTWTTSRAEWEEGMYPALISPPSWYVLYLILISPLSLYALYPLHPIVL